MKNILIDYRTSQSSIDMLEKLQFNIIKTKPINTLYDTVNGHPDMQIHSIAHKTFVCEPSVYHYYKEKLVNCKIICGNTHLTTKYPYDIAYNVLKIGNNMFHSLKYTDSKILEYYKSIGINLINVNQGYTKCSVCIISDNAIITSDKMIYCKAKENNIDALLINCGEIILSDINYGFIGGCTGLISENILAVNGNIKLHSEYERIQNFCDNHNVEILCLNKEKMIDIGSIILIN